MSCTCLMHDMYLIKRHSKKIKNKNMKKIIFVLLITIVTAVSSYGQSYSRHIKSSASDPAIENLTISDPTNGSVNTDMLVSGSPVKVQFTILNKENAAIVPAGSCRVMLTLGSKFKLATDLNNLQSLPLSNYFKWTLKQSPDSKQYIVFGILHKDLPASFAGNVSFMLVPSKVGSSTVVCQLLISNEKNPDNILSDNNPNNNSASLSYTNIKALNIKFIQFTAKPRSCMLDMNWSVLDNAKEAKQFVIEASENGVSFVPVKTIQASGGVSYGYLLEKMENTAVTVRVKAETENGQYLYSETIYKNDICNSGFDVSVYPNPVPSEITELALQAKAGIFNGKYSIKITNSAGSEIKRFEQTYKNAIQIKIKTEFLITGIYFVTLVGEDGKHVILKFVKQ
jgi:Secretion system C-terminal sorting domain